MATEDEQQEVSWLGFLGALKKAKSPPGEEGLERFRQTVLADVDFCWAAVEENGQAAHDQLRYVAMRMWPDAKDVPAKVEAVMAAGRVEVNW